MQQIVGRSDTARGEPGTSCDTLHDDIGESHIHKLIKCNFTVFPLTYHFPLAPHGNSFVSYLLRFVVAFFWTGL